MESQIIKFSNKTKVKKLSNYWINWYWGKKNHTCFVCVHVWWGDYGSRLLFGSGHKTSSTSQAMSSRTRHRGKYRLVCRIHPWIDPTSMSPDASSIACRRVMQACGCWSYTFHRHAENNSSIAFRKGLQKLTKGAGIKVWNGYGCWTNLGPEQPGGN